MVGGLILKLCLQSKSIGRVTSLVRRPSGISHPKLEEKVCHDFIGYEEMDEAFQEIDTAFFCLGAYTGQVEDKLFKQITVDYVVGFANKLKHYSPNACVCLLSGQGADKTEKSRISFAKYKGMAENYLLKKEFPSLHLFRPGYIYPVAPRKEPNLSYRISRWLYPVLRLLGPKFSVQSTELAEAMFKAGIEGCPMTILENADILDSIRRNTRS